MHGKTRLSMAVAAALFSLFALTSVAFADSTESFKPTLSIDIPQVRFSEITVQGDKGNRHIDIPWLAQYITGSYKYSIGLASIIATVMFMVGGFQYLTAGGATGPLTKGKERMSNAVVGMVMVLGAYTLLSVVSPDTLQPAVLQLKYVDKMPFGLPDDFPEAEHGSTFWDGQPEESAVVPSAGTLSVAPDADTQKLRKVAAALEAKRADTAPTLQAAAETHGGDGAVRTVQLAEAGDEQPPVRLKKALIVVFSEYPTFANKIGFNEEYFASLKLVADTIAEETKDWELGSAKLWGQGPRTAARQAITFAKNCAAGRLPDTYYQEGKTVCSPNVCSPYAYGAPIWGETPAGHKGRFLKVTLPAPNPLACSHTTGTAFDGACYPYSTNLLGGIHVRCQLALEKAMKEQGFCRLTTEPWHFEKPRFSKNCLMDWTIGEYEEAGKNNAIIVHNYANCDGYFRTSGGNPYETDDKRCSRERPKGSLLDGAPKKKS